MKTISETWELGRAGVSTGRTTFYAARVLGVRREGENDWSLRIALMGDLFVATKNGCIWSVVYDLTDDRGLVDNFMAALIRRRAGKAIEMQFARSGDMVFPSSWNKSVGIIVETDTVDRSKIVGFFPIGNFWSGPHVPHLPELKWAEE